VGGYSYLSTVEWREKQTGLPIDRFSDEVLFLAFEVDCLLDDGHRDFEQGRRCLNQCILMDGTVAIFGKLLQDVADACLGTDHRVSWNPQPLSQRIRRLEANTVNVEGETIGILLDAGNRLVAIGLVNAHSTRCPNAMRVQEDHNFSDDFLGFPGLNDPLFAFGTNAVKVSQPFGRLLNDVKDLLPKGLDQFFRKVWADPFDHP
jgi:hypothetical protein